MRYSKEKKMAGKVKIDCAGKKQIKLNDLIDFQGDLKELNPSSYEKLKARILELGFSEPIVVWTSRGKNYIINGHQRVATLKMMKDEGIEIPEKIPVAIVKATSKAEAKKKVLALTSTYGEVTKDGLLNFMENTGLDINYIADSFIFSTLNLERLRYEEAADIDIEKLEEELKDEDYNRQEIIVFYFEKKKQYDFVKDFFESDSKLIDGELLIKELV